MGSSCVRDCERSAHEYASEECLPNATMGFPGMSPGVGVVPAHGVKVGSPLANPYDAIRGSVEADNTMVPPVPNWFQVLKSSTPADAGPKETPRFDEVVTSSADGGVLLQATPRGGGSVAGELQTPGASPRDSPRPPDENAQGGKDEEAIYEGSYLGSMKHGTGRLRVAGCAYDGHFLNDYKHGNGVLTWDDGRQYRGQFETGKFHGSAVMTWPDGRKYCGQYVEDRKHGDGTFSWQDGRRYQGQWVVGKRHGVGVYTNAKGLTRTGMWQMDRPLHWDVPVNSSEPLPTMREEEGKPETD